MRICSIVLWSFLCFGMFASSSFAKETDSDKDKFFEIQRAFIDCSSGEGKLDTVENVHIYYRAQYECYKKVAFRLIDTFQPVVADEVKLSFLQYLDAYERMVYNQYLSLEPCEGNCGTIIEDYIVIDRAHMMESVVRGYLLAIKGYI